MNRSTRGPVPGATGHQRRRGRFSPKGAAGSAYGGGSRSIPRRSAGTDGWVRYEAEKRAWIEANPTASSVEVERAMRRIAQRLRV